MSPRATRLLVFAVIFTVFAGLAGFVSALLCFIPAPYLFPLAYHLSHRVAWDLTANFVSRLQCPRCAFQLPAVGVWTVGSYTDHHEQNIYNVRSPIDGKHIGWIDCPQCGSTIVL
ncbi:MAG: hypothetical protein HYS13_17720 [Planctomycetia bacterium]|nr:hypothetical protein [Planctomycetia bacterium]